MRTNEKKILRRVPPRHVGRMVETVVGCKWSLTVVDLVERGIRRPGAMERTVEGLTAKVLNDCLRVLVSYGILEKQSYPRSAAARRISLHGIRAEVRGDLQDARRARS